MTARVSTGSKPKTTLSAPYAAVFLKIGCPSAPPTSVANGKPVAFGTSDLNDVESYRMYPCGASSERPISTACSSNATSTSTSGFTAAIGSRDPRTDASAWPPRIRERTFLEV